MSFSLLLHIFYCVCAFLLFTCYIFSAELLKQVHAIGKASKNIFSAAQNFSSFSGDGDSSSNSPVISFKAHLIRLIGNLCHSNTNNQNKVCMDGWKLGWMNWCFHIRVWSVGPDQGKKIYTLLPFSSAPVCVHTYILQTNQELQT